MKLNLAALLLYLFLPESEVLENKASALLGVLVYLFCLFFFKPFLLVRREALRNFSESWKRKNEIGFPVIVPSLASHHSSRFSSQFSLFTKVQHPCV